jgi:threonine/homoserine/homoserine lactone efflux protein
MDLGVFPKGLLAGLAIAAPVGPVNVLCISRTLRKGWKAGLASGLGAATADALYGAIAGFSINFIIQLLLREEFWLRLIGGSFLIVVGVLYYFKRAGSLEAQESGSAKQSDFVSTLLLNLTNPTTVLSFLAVLAALRASQPRSWWLDWLLVLGIFCGSLLWWIVLIAIVNRFRSRFNDSAMLWMNRLAGLAIGGFGALTLVLSLSP